MSYRDPLLTSDGRRPAGDRRLVAAVSPRRLEVFRVTASTGSVTRAARLLELSQPTVSQHIQALEQELGTTLFSRSGSGLALTEFGTAFLAYALGILRQQDDLQALLARTSGRRSPPFRIAGIPSVLQIFLPAALADLMGSVKELSVDLQEGGTETVLEAVAAGQAEVGFIDLLAADHIPEDLLIEEIYHDRWYLIAAQSSSLTEVPLAEGLSAADARQMLFETVQLPSGNRAGQPARGWFDRMVPGHSVIARAQSYELLLKLVTGGLGAGIAPGLSLQGGRAQDLCARPLDLPPRRIAAVFSARRSSKERKALIAAVRRASGSVAEFDN